MVQGEFVMAANMYEVEMATRQNTIILMAARDGYYYDGFKSEGYRVHSIFKNVNIIGRIIREICFRIPVLPKKVWFNKSITEFKAKFFVVYDVLVTEKYLRWLKDNFPCAQINFIYNNMVGNARHLLPHQIPKGIRIWTYDGYDSQKYGIKLKNTNPYFPYFVRKADEKKYDVFFVGRDKGRGEKLLRFEKWMNMQGFKTEFIITKDGKFKRNKPYYKKEISYDENVSMVAQSKAILNVTMKNQRGVTLRDLECLFNKVKLVTTNKYIKNADFYNCNNIFILGEDDWKTLPEFINGKYDDSRPIDMDLYSAEAMIREITRV